MTQFHPPWFDPAQPDRDTCVVPRIIDRRAAAHPDREFIRFENGETWSWAETREKALQTAAALQARGVKPGDIVAAWAPNSQALVRAWFGCNYAGAALAPINTSFRGRLLEHALNKTDADILIVHPELALRLEGLSLGAITRVILTGASNKAPEIAATLEPHIALSGDAAAYTPVEVEPWDTPVIIFTSGTTGPSKAVVTSYVQEWTTARITYGYMTSEDRMLVNLPMFHVGGISGIMSALASGGAVALVEAFDTRQFWNLIRETQSTTCSGFIGALTTFLHKEPAKPDDRDNPLRICTLSPISEETVALSKRFGFDYVSGFNMTEVSAPLITGTNETTMRSCGRIRSGVECRLVDAHDREVPNGQVGELTIRTEQPWQLFKGYLGDPEATAQAWRNGWFHTGDLLWRDDEGRFYFVDRQKDAIRRRGENISSQEIEIEVSAYDDVREVAAYGVDLPGGEQEVMVCIAPKPGVTVDPKALIEFLIPRMAHFMVPRYVRVAAELPKTPTNKIQKVELRKEGVTADTWDREAAGMRLRREKLSTH
ncbi:MAG: AMP-binding protein [Alphaproteobacteria bacterium]|nr:AMP-binding protein [Alphaproteobacteria bacterium]MBU1512502.1 AMP-binding protein [Alphaproteobacteria bacterium]MBU2096574.1 AMP-binding protein [Alphaproteobacteria bacterium]MBU2151608.1 AMP-binding protein [Alphaproteobacteria bacterium]MBU2307326.1 AMP-binding protein [Alphaproteobacteria bacterium]